MSLMGFEIENVLIFGCRHRDKDYHYRQQWEQYEKDGHLKVFPAFSRDQVMRVCIYIPCDLYRY